MTENKAINAIRLQGGIEITGRAKRVAEFFEGLDIAVKALEDVREYRKLGTVEECRKAVEKTKAKKIKLKNSIRCCPLCGAIAQKDFGLCCSVEYLYCVNCGQRLESEE